MNTARQFARVLMVCLVVFSIAQADTYVPVAWTKFIRVEGQPEPVPEQWLQDEEARIAHNLQLPDSVPKPVPFDFMSAWLKSWLPGIGNVALQYFDHLCKTEAGEWIFKRTENVEGLYFARPQVMPSDDLLKDPFGPEAPWVQRHFQISGGSLHDDGVQFVDPPFANYRFVEQPRRPVKWQLNINEPYVRLFGYTTEHALDQNGHTTIYWKTKSPMQVVGVPEPTSRYTYTWRGLKRARDREHGVAGGELVIYDRQARQVLAVRRTFQITRRNPRGPGDALWLVAPSCANVPDDPRFRGIAEFAGRVLTTIEPSNFGRK